MTAISKRLRSGPERLLTTFPALLSSWQEHANVPPRSSHCPAAALSWARCRRGFWRILLRCWWRVVCFPGTRQKQHLVMDYSLLQEGVQVPLKYFCLPFFLTSMWNLENVFGKNAKITCSSGCLSSVCQLTLLRICNVVYVWCQH